jgi:hypothetical protein
VLPKLSLSAACSFVRVLGVLDLSVPAVARLALEKMRIATPHRTLSTPQRLAF